MRGIAIVVASTMFAMGVPDAAACGGFFCNAAQPVPIIQAGEQVVFARHNGLTSMHVQVTYSGDPTSFGWVLPLSETPLGDDGEALPLDRMLRLSHPALFNTLELATRPTFTMTPSRVENNCPSPAPNNAGCGMVMMATSARSGGGSFSNSDVPSADVDGVTLIDEATIGPYAAQLIEADNVGALYDWLNENGYLQDELARPILKHYVASDFVFLGLRLQNGKSVGDLRPVAITLGEAAPCVPLRLTSIAAAPDMPITVYVLGPDRAVPKNFLHGVINPQALTWPNAPDYPFVAASAVEEAGGRAFLTEYAGPVEPYRGRFEVTEEMTRLLLDPESTGAELRAVFSQWAMDNIPVTVPTPSPWAPNAVAVQQDPVYADLDAEFAATGDVDTFRRRLADELLVPMIRIESLFAETDVLTRLYTRLDPEDMTRDPIFSYNPDLPMVDGTQHAEVLIHGCGKEVMEVQYPDGTVHATDCNGMCGVFGAIVVPVPGVPALLVGEVADETGEPRGVHPEDLYLVDDMLASAAPGEPSVPGEFDLRAPEERPMVTGVAIPAPRSANNRDDDDSGCIATAAGTRQLGSLAPIFLLLLGIAALRRVSA